MRRTTWIRIPIAALFTLALVAVASADEDHQCRDVDGPFTSNVVPVPPCTSPVGLCTHGILTGDLDATYDFTAQTLMPANDPEHPNRLVYTGTSVITAAHGQSQMFSNDTGYLDMNADPTAASPFATTVVIQSGTYGWKHTGGMLVASGDLVFATGVAVGSYVGSLCPDHGSCDDGGDHGHDGDHGHGDDHGHDGDHGHGHHGR
jgi:hypothetical protein